MKKTNDYPAPTLSKMDDYSEYSCKDDAETVMKAMELMKDSKKWPRIKAHLEKKKTALMSLDQVLKKVQSGG